MSLCMGCFSEIGDSTVCPHCQFDNGSKQGAPFLPYSTELNKRYIVGKNIETNGESTKYIGYDKQTGEIVTVREYLPIGLFDRAEGEQTVTVPEEKADAYNEVLNTFIEYYKTVAQLSEMSATINILDIFRTNNTCYVIEENEELIPFTQYLSHSGGTLDWDNARPLFMPIISLLEAMHKNGIGHYAVSPDNLFVTPFGKLKLDGFSTEYERKRGTVLKSQLYSGCAALEQYENNQKLNVATDIYGFTSTLFYTLTGNLPSSAKERVNDPRLLISTNTVKRLPPHVVSALANGLQVNRETRIKDFDELRSQLSVASTVKAIQDEISKTASMTPIKTKDDRKKASNGAIAIVATVAALLIFSACGVFWLSTNPLKGVFADKETTVNATQTETQSWTGPTVPDYTGKVYEDVAKQLDDSGEYQYAKSIDGEYSDTVEAGKILSQKPEAGSPVENDKPPLYFVISKGPEMVKLPDVSNKNISDAAKTLTDLGFIVLEKSQNTNEYSDGTVIGYDNQRVDDLLKSGSEVTLIVARKIENTSQ